MPPCALAELHDCSEPFAVTATRAPARAAETAAARPEAPLPITSTSKEKSATTRRSYHGVINESYYCDLCVTTPSEAAPRSLQTWRGGDSPGSPDAAPPLRLPRATPPRGCRSPGAVRSRRDGRAPPRGHQDCPCRALRRTGGARRARAVR